MATYSVPKLWRAIIDRLPVSIEQQDSIRHVANRILSRRIDIREIRSVCLMLGPYRNLTTLTASIIALHPRCQVLNHGGPRILGDPRLNFFDEYSDRKFDRFVRFAIRSSYGGASGHRGGSILKSHAFQHSEMKEAYDRRFGDATHKRVVHCLFWKESLRVSNQIRGRPAELDEILRRNDRLRFLMPIRDPMDAARSNTRTGHSELFPGLEKDSPEDVVRRRILEEFAWFLDLHDRHPDRFFWYYEHTFAADTVAGLGRFLKLDTDPEWESAAQAAFVLNKSYTHSEATRQAYRSEVEDLFQDRPAVRRELLRFAEPVHS